VLPAALDVLRLGASFDQPVWATRLPGSIRILHMCSAYEGNTHIPDSFSHVIETSLLPGLFRGSVLGIWAVNRLLLVIEPHLPARLELVLLNGRVLFSRNCSQTVHVM
jgi:hypothetical protein